MGLFLEQLNFVVFLWEKDGKYGTASIDSKRYFPDDYAEIDPPDQRRKWTSGSRAFAFWDEDKTLQPIIIHELGNLCCTVHEKNLSPAVRKN